MRELKRKVGDEAWFCTSSAVRKCKISGTEVIDLPGQIGVTVYNLDILRNSGDWSDTSPYLVPEEDVYDTKDEAIECSVNNQFNRIEAQFYQAIKESKNKIRDMLTLSDKA